MSRVDALSGIDRELIRAASVIGQAFDLPTLAATVDVAREIDLEANLNGLETLDLVSREEGAAEGRFRFRHALIQEVAYESILYSRRRDLHRRVGTHLEDTYAGRLESVCEVLFHHYSLGGERAKTLTYALQSADRARGVFANDEAVEYYRRALAMSGDGVDGRSDLRARIHEALADVQELVGRHDEAVRHFSRAILAIAPPQGRSRPGRLGRRVTPRRLLTQAGAHPPATRRAVSEICRKIGYVFDRRSDYDLALAWLEESLRLLPARSTGERSRACTAIAGLRYRAGEFDEAEHWCLRGLRHARNGGQPTELAHAYNLLGVVRRDRGQVRKAINHRLQALEMYTQLGDLAGQADTLNNLGLDHTTLGEWQQAIDKLQDCLRIARRIGDEDLIAMVHNNLGEVYLPQGDVTRAKAEFRWTMEATSSLGNTALGALAETNLGQALAGEGRLAEARHTLEHSLRILRAVSAHAFEADVLVRLADVLLQEGRRDEAEGNARTALDMARRLNLQPIEASAVRLLAMMAAADERWDVAITSLRAAAALFARSGARYEIARTEAAVGRVYAAKFATVGAAGDRRSALRALRRAASEFDAIGAAADLQAAESELTALAPETGTSPDDARREVG